MKAFRYSSERMSVILFDQGSKMAGLHSNGVMNGPVTDGMKKLGDLNDGDCGANSANDA